MALATTGITTSLVGNTIGSSSRDVGTLCTSSQINKWSKYKPVPLNQTSFAIDAKFPQVNPFTVTNVNMPWYAGDMSSSSITNCTLYQMYGLNVPVINSVANATCVSIIDNYSSNGANWEKVSIPSSYPKRLGDFRGYDHNVESPFYTYVTPTVYKGESVGFQASYESESSNGLSLSDFGDIFTSAYTTGVIVTKGGSVVGYYDSGESITNGGVGANWYTNISTAGTYKAYFVARNTTTEKTVPYPSTSDYPNPMSFTVSASLNPSTNPWNNLSYDLYGECGFAYNNTMAYYEPFYNVQENDYTTLNTTGSFCFYLDITPTQQQYLNLGLIDFKWVWAGTGSTIGSPQHKIIINNSVYTNSGYTFAEGTTTRVYFQFDDMFYDANTSTRYSPTEEETFTIDALEMYYNGVVQEYIYLDLTYSVYHNGYFYNSYDGYYQTK